MKAAAMRKVSGVRSHHKAPDTEPDYEVCAPDDPEHLSTAAEKHWAVMAVELYEAGVMTTADVDALAIYCETYVPGGAEKKALQSEDTIMTGSKGAPIRNPRIALVNQLYRQLQQMMNHFGITPKTRNKVKSNKPKGGAPTGKPQNRFAALGF